MGKSLLKYNKPLTINALPIISGYNKSGIQQTVKNFKPQPYKNGNILKPHRG